MAILEHLEDHLGPICGGWRPKSHGGIGVVRFPDRPTKGASTFVTHGLSDQVLAMPKGREVRLEFLFAAHDHDKADSEAIASFLGSFADHIANRRRALLRGDVVGPGDPIIPGVRMNAVYASVPVVYEDSLAEYEGTSPHTVLVWLIPLHPEEARYVKTHGWKTFEETMELKDPDLLDLERESFIEKGHGNTQEP